MTDVLLTVLLSKRTIALGDRVSDEACRPEPPPSMQPHRGLRRLGDSMDGRREPLLVLAVCLYYEPMLLETNMLRLYGDGRSRWVKPYWVLRELGVPFEPVPASPSRGETRTPEYLQMNPFGKVPVLVEDDGTPIFESHAICTYVADKHFERGLIPKPGTIERARHDQWVSFVGTELEQPLWRISRHSFIYPPEKRSSAEIELARDDFRSLLRRLAPRVSGATLLTSFSVADICLAYTLRWAASPANAANGDLLADAPSLRVYMENLCRRPSFPRELYESG